MRKRNVFQKICIYAGITLLLAAAALMVFWQWGIGASQQQSAEYVQMLRTLIPEPQDAMLEERSDNTMPVLSLEGNDFSGILEMPRYGSVLPVGAAWRNPSQYPHCFSGSIYDGSIQIGTTSQKGQYDFYREISVGDSLYFTDMAGNRYAYTVTDLRYEKHADQTVLQQKDADLTLFIKNVYAFEYILVFCDISG